MDRNGGLARSGKRDRVTFQRSEQPGRKSRPQGQARRQDEAGRGGGEGLGRGRAGQVPVTEGQRARAGRAAKGKSSSQLADVAPEGH